MASIITNISFFLIIYPYLTKIFKIVPGMGEFIYLDVI